MTTSVWTEDLVDRLKILWREGRSAAEVARALKNGVTRSAVLGKVHRLGLSEGRLSPPKVPGRPKLKSGAEVGPRRRPAGAAGRTAPKPRPALTAAAPTFGTATILSVRRFDCRWPYGDPQGADFALCGRKVVRGAFCAAHATIGYRPHGAADRMLKVEGLS